MNGYVDRLQQRIVEKTDYGVKIEAEITVSASRIVNFVGYSPGGSGDVKGGELSADISRELAQRKARGEIFDRVLRGFPSSVMQVKIDSITPSEANPTQLVIQVEYSYKRDFQRLIEGTLKALGAQECRPEPRLGRRTDFAIAMANNSVQNACLGIQGGGQPLYRDVVCLGSDTVIRCYELPQGSYCSACVPFQNYIDPPELRLYGRFVDEGGSSVAKDGSSCEEFKDARNPTPSVAAYVGRVNGRFAAAFDFTPGRSVIVAQSGRIDLEKARRFVAVIAIKSGIGALAITNVFPDSGEAQSGCALLDQNAPLT
jgi:hypothetical protein